MLSIPRLILTAIFLLTTRLAGAATDADAPQVIAILGTGSMGSALGVPLAAAGHRVVYGSRDPAQDKVRELVERTGHGAEAATQPDAGARADVIILAVPGSVVEDVVAGLGGVDGKVLIDITGEHSQAEDGYFELHEGPTAAERLQARYPGARVVATAFSAADVIAHPERYDGPIASYIAADDRVAKEITARLAIDLGLFPLDAGPLRMSRIPLGQLFLTPMVQGRKAAWVWAPRLIDLSCMDTTAWFEKPVSDAGRLAYFPNLEAVEVACPEGAGE